MLAIFVLGSVLWATEGLALLPADGGPGTSVISKGIGTSVEVILEDYPDGDVRLEIEMESPHTGARRSLGTVTGTVQNGRLRVSGPNLTEDERWHTLRVSVFTSDGKLAGFCARVVR